MATQSHCREQLAWRALTHPDERQVSVLETMALLCGGCRSATVPWNIWEAAAHPTIQRLMGPYDTARRLEVLEECRRRTTALTSVHAPQVTVEALLVIMQRVIIAHGSSR